MTSEKGFAAYNLLDRVADDLIMDALLPEDRGAAVLVKGERPHRLSAFFESGWGVAIICALVAVSVMGGIIWAGNRSGMSIPPAGTVESDKIPTQPEVKTETIDIALHPQDAVVIYGEEDTCYPPKFLCNSTTLTEGADGLNHGETADGLGFEGVMQHGETPVLPTVIWVKDTELTDFVDVAEGYIVKEFKMYNMDMQLVESGSYVNGYDSEQSVNRFIKKNLSVGTWYMSLRVEHDGGEMHHCVYDYAFAVDVRQTSNTLDLDVYAFAYDDAEHKIPLDERACWEEKVWDEMAGEMVDVDVDAYFYIREAASELPVVTAREGNGCAIVGVEVRRYFLYDQDFNLLYSGREWSNPVEAGRGTFYVEIVGYKQGNYIPEADDYEDGIYTYAFRLEVLPDYDDSGAETELPYFAETTPED